MKKIPVIISSVALALVLASVEVLGASGATSVRIRSTGTDAEGRKQYQLSWDSVSNAVYRVESRPTLGAATPWQTFDAVTATGATAQIEIKGRSIPENSIEFFRLVLPEPEIFSIEPARFAFGGTTVLYVIGQCFDSNTTVRVQPQAQAPSYQIVHPGLLRVSFTPQTPGTYEFELVRSGTVLSSFPVECYDASAPPASVLQEPPDEPWASPRSSEVTGLDVYIDTLEIQEGGVNSGAHKVKEKGNRTKCTSNLRVTPSGELELDEVDLFIPGVGLDFIWGRRYLSRSGPNTAQGNRWDFSYNVSVAQVAGNIEVRDGMGHVTVLKSDQLFPAPVYGADGVFYIGQFTNSLFRLTFPDKGYWEFEHPGGGVGKLLRIVDRNRASPFSFDVGMRFQYDAMDRLVRIIDSLDRTNVIAYSPDGRISSVTDFSGRRVTYAYYRAGEAGGSDGDLKSVTTPPVTGTPNGNDFPAGKTTTYTYSRGFADPRENSLLLTITDPKGQVTHEHVYQHNQTDLEFLRLRASRIGFATDIITYSYVPQSPAPSNQFAVQKIIVNDRVGNVSEQLYDARHRLLNLREFTGRAVPGLHVSETTNRPAGKLRADDPAYFETRFEWNNDSLCTRVVHPRGNSTELVYQRAFNQNSSRSNHTRRHNGNLRVLRERACCGGADTDGDGDADLFEGVSRFVHAPDLGSSAAVAIPAFMKNARKAKTAEAVTNVKKMYDGARAGSGLGFVVSATDPRGTVTTANYDSRGNLLHAETYERKSGAIIACDYSYDSRGRLTSQTHPADGEGCRRVDTFEYHANPAAPGFGYLSRATVDNGAVVCGRTDHFRLATSYEYDARGNVVRCVDPRGFDTLWTYNALDQCVLRQTPNTSFGSLVRYATTFFYDANDNLVRVDHENRDHTGALDSTNPTWSSFAEYDLLNRQTLLAHELTHVVQQRSTTNRFYYDANSNLIRIESPEAVNGNDPNNVEVCRFDERDLLFECVAAPGTGLGATNRFDYDGNANCKKVNKVDAFTIKTKVIEHDGFDRPVRVTDAMGNVLTRAFDPNGNLVFERLDGELEDQPGSAQNRRLSQTRYEYDALGRITRFRPAFFDVFTDLAIGDGEATTSFSYAPNGLLLSETDDNAHQTRYRYDSANRLLAVSRGLIESGPFEEGVQVCTLAPYDANGNVLMVTQTDRSDLGGAPQVFTMTYEYDGLNRLTRASDNMGNNQNWSFNSQDNLVRTTDANGNLTGYTYDGLSRRTLAIADLDGDGLLDRFFDVFTDWSYDDNSRLTSVTDDNTNTTLYAYDALDRRTLATSPDGTAHVFVWDAFDNLAQSTDPSGTRVTCTYDLLDRCVRRDIAPARGVAPTTTFETFAYDGASRVVRASNNGVTHTFVWNSLSDLSEQSSGGLTLRATHDGVGNRTSVRYPSGLAVGYVFDKLNQVTSITRCEGCGNPWLGDLVANYSYDGPGRVVRIARANGVNTRINWGGYAGAMQLQGDFGWQQVTRVNHQVAQGGTFLDTRVFAHDRAQNRTLRAQTAPFSTGGVMNTNRFSYDPLHRLIQSVFNDARQRNYALDGNGNRHLVTETGIPPMTYQMDNTLPEPADFQMNQYTLTPFGPRLYDRNGNQVAIDGPAGATVFTYDYADRLVSVQRTVGPAMVPVADYAYDALGRRVSKTVYPEPPMAPVTTSYFLDADCDGDGIIEAARFGERPQFVYKTGTRVAMITTAGEPLYYHEDDLENVLAFTDSAGRVLERYDYDDYGLPRLLDAKGDPLTDATGQPVTGSPVGNPFLFHGMFWDAETGLYCQWKEFSPAEEQLKGNPRHRTLHVDPQLGRQLGRPKYEDIGVGDRSFAGNNPWSAPARMVGATKWKNIVLKRGLHGGGGGGGSGGASEVMFNPKEYTITKSTPWKSSSAASHGKWKTFRGGGIRMNETASRMSGGHVEGPWHGGGWIPDPSCAAKQDVYVWKLKKEEGGRHTPFHNKYRPQFYFRTTDVTGEIELESGREMTTGADWDYRRSTVMDPHYSYYKFGLARGSGWKLSYHYYLWSSSKAYR